MIITLTLRPEIEAALARKAALHGRALETYAAALLEEALLEEAAQLAPESSIELLTADPRVPTGQDIVDACAKVRGLFTDEEVDAMQASRSAPVPSMSVRLSGRTGSAIVAAMQAMPYKDVDIEPYRPHLPVRDVTF